MLVFGNYKQLCSIINNLFVKCCDSTVRWVDTCPGELYVVGVEGHSKQ